MLMMRAFYMHRRLLETEKKKMGKTKVIWEGRRMPIDEIIAKLKDLAQKEEQGKVFIQARVTPIEPSPTELTEFSDVKIEYL